MHDGFESNENESLDGFESFYIEKEMEQEIIIIRFNPLCISFKSKKHWVDGPNIIIAQTRSNFKVA